MKVSRVRQMFRASGAAFVQRIAQLVTTVVTVPLVLHTLGVAGFGVWGAATSVAWLSSVVDLGIGSALLTLLPRALASENAHTVRSYVAVSLLGGLGLSLVIIVVGSMALRWGASNQYMGPFGLSVVAIGLNVPLSLASSIWYGMQKGEKAAYWELAQTGLSFVFLLWAVACHASVIAFVLAVYASLILANVASWIHLLLTEARIHPTLTGHPLARLHEVLTHGGLLFAITVISAAGYAFDNFLAIFWLGTTASAQVAIALRLCTTIAGILAIVTQPIWPALVAAMSEGDGGWVLNTVLRGTLLVAGASVIGAVLLVTVGPKLLNWWLHSDVGIGGAMLWASGFWVIVLNTPRIVGLLFNAVSILRFQLAVAMTVLGAAMILKGVLARNWGAAGIIAATPLAWICIVWPAYTWRAHRWMVSGLPIRIQEP
jgi:O-antigen/teichoic acid export membrane protein